MIISKYVEGYSSEAKYCPFCGDEIYDYKGDGASICNDCGKEFYIVERE